MGGRSWTELFFLDEATALAAGHRPCFFCRRDDANRFRAAWEEGNGVSDIRAREMDAALHRERLERGKKRLHPLPMPVAQLPDGAMVQAGDESLLIVQGRALQWSMAGYRETEAAIENAHAADAAIIAARAEGGVSAGAASECGEVAKVAPLARLPSSRLRRSSPSDGLSASSTWMAPT